MSTIKGCNIGGRAMKACVDLLNDVSDNRMISMIVTWEIYLSCSCYTIIIGYACF